jgi:hypothetical protein
VGSGSEWARTPQKERGGSPLDGFGHIRVKRIELQLEATRDGGQTDLARGRRSLGQGLVVWR